MPWPFVPTPLPALELYRSVAVCGPYLETAKLTEVTSFATNGSIGTVSKVCAPAPVLPLMNAVALPSDHAEFSKYQSFAELRAPTCQLYVEVWLPPHRCTVAPTSFR